MIRYALAALAVMTSAAAADVPPPSTADLPAGTYTVDKPHTSLLFRVSHLGFSHWTGRFTRVDAELHFDPKAPESASVSATVDAASLSADNPPDGFLAELTGPEFLDAGKYPQITFKSTKVEVTGANTAKVTGDFTLHGVTHPLTLDATFNGGYAGHPMDPAARIGFSATGQIKRSDYGIAYGIPAPGTTMGVSDEVDIIIETELNGPPLKEVK